MRDGHYSTDDSALVERTGGKVKIVMGSYGNIKITTPEDLNIAETLLKIRSKQ
jgi:2-C-methyl-D-erythritol 4-phosphate cytidylyltransferase